MIQHIAEIKPEVEKYQCSLINVGPNDMLSIVLNEYSRARKAGKGE